MLDIDLEALSADELKAIEGAVADERKRRYAEEHEQYKRGCEGSVVPIWTLKVTGPEAPCPWHPEARTRYEKPELADDGTPTGRMLFACFHGQPHYFAVDADA